MNDIRKFEDADGNEIELDRRRIISAEQLIDVHEGDGSRIDVCFKPHVWSADEGDDPTPAHIDIRADVIDFAKWIGKPVNTIKFEPVAPYFAEAARP